MYLRYAAVSTLTVLCVAFVQIRWVLGVEVSPFRLIIPALVGLGFGLMLARIRDLSERHRETAARLVQREHTILELNRALSSAVESKTAELRDTEKLLGQLFESAADAILYLGPAGIIELSNPAMGTLTGLSQDDLLGLRPHELPVLERDDAERVAKAITAICEGGAERQHGLALTIVRADGTRRVAEAIVQCVPADGGQTGIQVRIRDVTDLREVEDLEKRLRQAQKLESVGRLAGGVAHDFNNLLAVVMVNAELIAADLPPGSQAVQEAERILEAAERGASLTRQLLAFSRRQVLEKQVLDMRHVLSGMEGMLRRLIGEDVELRVALPENPCAVEADRSQLEQVFLNLAVNARDAMPHGGRLSMEVTDRGAPPELGPGPFTCLIVKDTGTGMDAETMSHVFEPFFTTKGPDEGTGLGLATVHGIVNQSGGDVFVESVVGEGTTFTLCFPQARAAPARLVTNPVSSERPAVPGTILLVEDEESVRHVIRRTLESRGWTIVEAGDAMSAMHSLDEPSHEFRLLLTDVVMPGISGPQLAEKVRERQPDLPVIFMSGYVAREETIIEALGAEVLYKPFTAKELFPAIERALRPNPAEPS